MLYQNGQVILFQLSPFSGQYLVKLNVARWSALCRPDLPLGGFGAALFLSPPGTIAA